VAEHAAVGQGAAAHTRIDHLVDDLVPMCRSIMGPGTRATLERIGRDLPLVQSHVPSGSSVLDWVVPDEWAIEAAWIARADDGARVLDFHDCFLHVVSHSTPVRERMTLDELAPSLHSLAHEPDLIPYRTQYYAPGWGLCIADSVRTTLQPGRYDVCIDSELRPGALSWGEVTIPGRSADTVLLTTHICHPTMFNDNMSGIAVLAELAHRLLSGPQRRFTYRLAFIPGTIGALAWLSANHDHVGRIVHGLVLTGLGDSSPFTYKQSRRGDADIDRIVEHILRERASENDMHPDIRPFSPYGYDERQFCSPGYNLPIGRLTRGVHGEYRQYHTSGDDRTLVSTGQMVDAANTIEEILDALEANRRYVNLSPFGEPQLGRRDLYRTVGGNVGNKSAELGHLWMLNQSDGSADLFDIAAASKVPWRQLDRNASQLADAGLLAAIGDADDGTNEGDVR
jgi:aminopeptidase-like protein